MTRIQAIQLENATGKAKELLDVVQTKLGMVPNMTRAMANAPAVLDAYLSFSGALSKGKLPSKLREQIAITVSERNGCNYCLSAHSAIGKMVGLSQEQILDSRRGTAIDSKTDAVLRFAGQLIDNQGRVDDEDVAALRKAGLDDATIAEVVAHVALSVFTNYFNNVAEPVIDFPKAAPLSLAHDARDTIEA